MNILGEFDQAEYEKIVEREKREAVEKARAEMKKEELAKVAHAVSEGFISANVAADLFGVDPDDLEEALKR